MNVNLTIVLIALDVLLTGAIIYVIIRYRRLYRAYDIFMRGSDAESLEEIILSHVDAIAALKEEDHVNKDAIRSLNRMQRSSYQKLGVVNYNAFEGMGGNLSFAVAMLDYTNSGFILNSVYSREGCYNYIKLVDCGKTEILLGREEQEALEQALGYRDREEM